MNNPLATWLLQDSTRTLKQLQQELITSQGFRCDCIEIGPVLRTHLMGIESVSLPIDLPKWVQYTDGTRQPLVLIDDYKAHLQELEDWCHALGIEEIEGSYRVLLPLS